MKCMSFRFLLLWKFKIIITLGQWNTIYGYLCWSFQYLKLIYTHFNKILLRLYPCLYNYLHLQKNFQVRISLSTNWIIILVHLYLYLFKWNKLYWSININSLPSFLINTSVYQNRRCYFNNNKSFNKFYCIDTSRNKILICV